MKRSSSKLHIRTGSMSHIGTTPYKFKIDVFISYVDNIKNATEVCVTWERRGKTHATSVVKVKDDKAVLRETMSMESTLFRRNVRDKGKKGQADTEQLKFDEKKVKFVLRKGGPEGKAVGKISMNIAEYVRGISSTVFADLKLSNGSVIVTKIEANMLHMGKKMGSTTGSEAFSEASGPNSLDTDSLFGEDENLSGDLEIPATMTPPPKAETEISTPRASMSPVSSTSCSPAGPSRPSKELASPRPQGESPHRRTIENESEAPPRRRATIALAAQSPKPREEELKSSPSLRQKLRSKIKEKTSNRKDKEDDAISVGGVSSGRKSRAIRVSGNQAEVKELRLLVESLKEENAKLRKSKQAAMDEIDALRSDLEACENALEEAAQNASKSMGSSSYPNVTSQNAKDRRIAELTAQNQSLIDELEECHNEDVQSKDGKGLRETIRNLNKKIADLEVALRREPQFLDVVNELKVTKVSLALANMEREQAIFAMVSLKHELGVDD